MWAIIGGSGFENFSEFQVLEELKIETKYGAHSSGLKKVKWKDQEGFFLSRHGSNHELLPSEVNFHANINALAQLGVKEIFSFSAVGSLREELAPLEVVFPDQYIDFTKFRKSSFAGEGRVGHYPFAEPVPKLLTQYLSEIFPKKIHFNRTYICVEGPRFSTKAESHMFRSFGADIIGMTHMPEVPLAREAGMIYLPFCFVTDFDCWKEDEAHVDVKTVKERFAKNFEQGREILSVLMTASVLTKISQIERDSLDDHTL